MFRKFRTTGTPFHNAAWILRCFEREINSCPFDFTATVRYPQVMPGLVVQKYGGMCLATPEKVKEVAQKVAERRRLGHSVLVIVSAMGKTTDELIRLAYQISPTPNRRELDMLLSTGERVSMALLTMALSDLGIDAISFTGSQAGVMTDASHSNAKIIDVRPIRLKEELTKGKVIVLAGFQGVNPESKEITTLGRGGSDTTAVAIAAALGAESCEMIKEVEGLCSADPRLVKQAHVFPEMSYQSLAEMCFWGAKVLHYRSVELAMTTGVPLFLKFSGDPTKGTRVTHEVKMFENQQILAVNSLSEVHHLTVPNAGSMQTGTEIVQKVLDENRLAWPQILAATMDQKDMRFMYTSDSEHLSAIQKVAATHPRLKIPRSSLSSVTLTCHGSVASDLTAKVVQLLARHGIAVEKLVTSPLSVSVIVEPANRDRTIQHLAELVQKSK